MEISVKDLKLPKEPGKAPAINWGEDFENFDDMKKIIYLKKLCSALNQAAEQIHIERNEVLEKCQELVVLAENANKAVDIQKAIVRNAIDSYNKEKQELISRLQELEAEVKLQKSIIDLYESK